VKETMKEAWRQYVGGAISYVEFVRFAWSQVTEQDVAEHNSVCPESDTAHRAEWPFEG